MQAEFDAWLEEYAADLERGLDEHFDAGDGDSHQDQLVKLRRGKGLGRKP